MLPLSWLVQQYDISMIVYISTFVNISGILVPMTVPTGTHVASTGTCCSRLTGGILSPDQAQQLATLFKALSDPNRVRLLSLIAAHAGQEACICDLVDPVGLTQPTVSHHMKQLVDAGLVIREQRGRWAFYRLLPDALNSVSNALQAG